MIIHFLLWFMAKLKEFIMPKKLEYFLGKTILITGAASGIGRETARIFSRVGANVVCLDIDLDANSVLAEEINSSSGKAISLGCDVTDRNQVERCIKLAIEQFGQIDFQFNSAGSAMQRCSFLEIDSDLWDSTFNLNSKGVFNCMQAVLPNMLENGKGVIVNIASMSHKRGGPNSSIHYAAAKGAVVSMSMGVAREFADKGIRCLSISPGPIDTAFQAAANTSEELKQKFLGDIPMKRFGRPEEIGELVLFICSDSCEFMTADTIYVNGGGGWR